MQQILTGLMIQVYFIALQIRYIRLIIKIRQNKFNKIARLKGLYVIYLYTSKAFPNIKYVTNVNVQLNNCGILAVSWNRRKMKTCKLIGTTCVFFFYQLSLVLNNLLTFFSSLFQGYKPTPSTAEKLTTSTVVGNQHRLKYTIWDTTGTCRF